MTTSQTEHQNNQPLFIASVSYSIYLTENQIAELAQIGSQHLYAATDNDDPKISYGGILEIIQKYEEFRKNNNCPA